MHSWVPQVLEMGINSQINSHWTHYQNMDLTCKKKSRLDELAWRTWFGWECERHLNAWAWSPPKLEQHLGTKIPDCKPDGVFSRTSTLATMSIELLIHLQLWAAHIPTKTQWRSSKKLTWICSLVSNAILHVVLHGGMMLSPLTHITTPPLQTYLQWQCHDHSKKKPLWQQGQRGLVRAWAMTSKRGKQLMALEVIPRMW